MGLFGAGAMPVLRERSQSRWGGSGARRRRGVAATGVWVLSMPRYPLFYWTAPSLQTLAGGGLSRGNMKTDVKGSRDSIGESAAR